MTSLPKPSPAMCSTIHLCATPAPAPAFAGASAMLFTALTAWVSRRCKRNAASPKKPLGLFCVRRTRESERGLLCEEDERERLPACFPFLLSRYLKNPRVRLKCSLLSFSLLFGNPFFSSPSEIR
jgi:hypothetical protein